MLTASLRRKTLFLLLIILLVTSWASAAGTTPASLRGERNLEGTSVDLLGRLWSLILGGWGKAGCIIDPNGCCLPQTPTPPAKEGCHIDPNGIPRCTP